MNIPELDNLRHQIETQALIIRTCHREREELQQLVNRQGHKIEMLERTLGSEGLAKIYNNLAKKLANESD